MGAGVGWFAWFAFGVPVGAATTAMAASTKGRHRVRLTEPGGRPLGLRSLMLKVGVGELGALGGGGFGGRMVLVRILS
jgi:hypothetical protein